MAFVSDVDVSSPPVIGTMISGSLDASILISTSPGMNSELLTTSALTLPPVRDGLAKRTGG